MLLWPELVGGILVKRYKRFLADLIKVVKDIKGIHKSNLGGCRFVKLIGEQGWKESK